MQHLFIVILNTIHFALAIVLLLAVSSLLPLYPYIDLLFCTEILVLIAALILHRCLLKKENIEALTRILLTSAVISFIAYGMRPRFM